MREHDLRQLVAGTKDAAYVTDNRGCVAAWNQTAETLFGVKAREAIGRSCSRLVKGSDQTGRVCSPNCIVQQALQKATSIENFDMQVQTSQGMRWCNVSVLISQNHTTAARYAVHIVRPIDVTKRLELTMRDFVLKHTNLTKEQCTQLLTSSTAATSAELSEREHEVLRMLASGGTTKEIAANLHISCTTVNNHIQHILQKLDSHTRLEAVRRAERGGLV